MKCLCDKLMNWTDWSTRECHNYVNSVTFDTHLTLTHFFQDPVCKFSHCLIISSLSKRWLTWNNCSLHRHLLYSAHANNTWDMQSITSPVIKVYVKSVLTFTVGQLLHWEVWLTQYNLCLWESSLESDEERTGLAPGPRIYGSPCAPWYCDQQWSVPHGLHI